MLVSRLIETNIPYREKKALRAVLRQWGDIECGRALHLINTEPTPSGQNAATWVTYQSSARKALDRALGVAPKQTRSTKARRAAADPSGR